MRYLVRVKTNRPNEEVTQLDANTLAVSVKAQPERGKANAALVKVLATHFKIRQSQIRIVAGHKIKNKIVEIKR